MGRHGKGEAFVVGGYEGFHKTLGDADPRTRAALDRVVALYEAWGRVDQAAVWAAKRPARAD